MPNAGYVSPFVRRQRVLEKQRAQTAAKKIADQRRAANELAPPSASAIANDKTGTWNEITLTNALFDPKVKKNDIFRLQAREPSNTEKSRRAIAGRIGPDMRQQVAESIANVLTDGTVQSIFHRDVKSGMIKVPESVLNLRSSLEPIKETKTDQSTLQLFEESTTVPSYEPRSSNQLSPRSNSGRASPSFSSVSPRSGSPRSGSPRSSEMHTGASHTSQKKNRGFLSTQGVSDIVREEVGTSPMDLSLVCDVAGDTEGFGLDLDATVPIPPYPYAQSAEIETQMSSLVTALNGLVRQMERREGSSASPVGMRRALVGAGTALEDSFVFQSTSRKDGVAELSPRKHEARVLLGDKVMSHLEQHVLRPTAVRTTEKASGVKLSHIAKPSVPESELNTIAPHSLGAVRDLILTKLQDVERCHAAAIDLLQRSQETEAVLLTKKPGQTTTNNKKAKVPVDLAQNARISTAGVAYETDAARLENAIHNHALPQPAWNRPEVTRLPRAGNSGSKLHFSCSHHKSNDERADVITFEQKLSAPLASLRASSGMPMHSQLFQQAVSSPSDAADEEVAEYERKQTAHFTRELRAPCYSSTHETALRAQVLKIDHTGAALEFGAKVVNREKPIESSDYKLLAMQEQRRQAMNHLPKLPAPASVTQDFKEWRKQMRFARDMRNMALESRGISHNFFLNRATEMIVSGICQQVAEEIDHAIEEEAARFVTKI